MVRIINVIPGSYWAIKKQMLKSTSQQPAKALNFSIIGSLFNRRWIVSTIIVAIASMVMIRLGIWQLDRLEQRRIFNSQVMLKSTNQL